MLVLGDCEKIADELFDNSGIKRTDQAPTSVVGKVPGPFNPCWIWMERS